LRSWLLIGCLSVAAVAGIRWISAAQANPFLRQNPAQLPGGATSFAQPASPQQQAKDPQVEDQLLVKFKDQASEASMQAAHGRARANVLKKYKILKNLHLVKLPKNMTVKEAALLYRENPDVSYAEPNTIIRLETTPNDPSFPSLWGLQNTGQNSGTPDADIDATQAWDITRGSSSVVVAVVDTGIDYNHPDLAANIWSNTADCNNNGIDDDGNGYIDDCHGIDLANGDSNPMDDHSHGTHVAGIIGASGNNSAGVVGVNWNVSLMACKFISSGGSGTLAAAIGCLEYVQTMKDRGVNIVATNNSWASNQFSQALLDAIEAHRQRGILFVAAAGNDAFNNDTASVYPANYFLPNIISVAATTRTDSLAYFSNFGRRSVHVGAPGHEILSTTPSNTYSTYSGTSMATPHVTGLTALLKAQDPSRDWKAIRNLILSGGDTISALSGTITQRRINAFGSLACLGSVVVSRLRPVRSVVSGTIGQPVDLAALHINCAVPNGPVIVGVDNGQTVTLLDDGLANDQVAGDGIYSGQWTPPSQGSFNLSFPGGDVVTVHALSNYAPVSTVFNWRTFTGASLNLGDDAAAQITSPFPILFGGGNFTSLFVGSNGYISFSNAFTEYFNLSLPTSRISTLVSPFWDDLSPTSNQAQNVYWGVLGTAPNRELVVEWRDVPHYSCPAENGVKFQVVFFEGSSDVVFNHADVIFGSPCSGYDQGASATVGIQVSSALASQYSIYAPSLSNNTALLWKINVPPTDLIVSSVSAPAASPAGASITISDTTTNQGPSSSDPSTTKLYLSANTTVDASDLLLGSQSVPGLASDASSTASMTVTLPAGTAGSYYILARADANNEVAEVNESNNVSYSFLQIGADLTISAFSAPPTGGAGGTITVTDTTRNLATVAADVSVTRFYLSTDSAIDAADTMLGGRAVPSLPAGAVSTGSTSVTLPTGISAGIYYVMAKTDADNTVAEISETNNITYVLIQIGSDLVISSFNSPVTGGAGATITVSDTTRNQGGGDAGASVTRFYLSSDAAVDAGDSVLGSRAVPSLTSGGSNSGSISATIPASTGTGSYYIVAKTDADNLVSEISETNNVTYSAIQIGADLVMSGLTAPSVGGAGSSITINDTTKNQGGGTAIASITRFYLSSDALIDAADTMLGSRSVGSLAAGATSSGSTSVTIPASTPAGSYYILAKADADNVVAETGETNNTTFTFIQTGPDLIVATVSAGSNGGAGLPLTVTDTTRNQGAGNADPSVTRFYLSSNGTLDAADSLLGSRSVASQAAGASSTANTTVTIPAGTATGLYYLFAKADADGTVSETTETNNISYATLTVGPDLVMYALSAPSSGGAGTNITVNDTAKNQGAGDAGASTTRFYLSTDSTVDASDVVLGARPVPLLAAGATNSAATTVMIPAGTAAGFYYLLAKADADSAVTETIETNNTTYAFITIGSDLVTLSISAPSVGGAGASITITETTKNQGSGVADPSTTKFYLSSNTTVDAADIFLGGRPVPSLGSGATSSGSTTVTIPAGTPAGFYYLLGKADADGVVTETSETNNTNYTYLTVGSDLVMYSLTAPSSGGAGSALAVSDTTRNQGGGSADASVTRFYLSTNSYLDAPDIVLGSRPVPSLAAGVSNSASTSVTIPAGTATGFYYLLAKADADDSVGESNETNNTTYAYLYVGPDLVMSSLTAPQSGGAGAPLSITDGTRNQGGGTASASTTSFYLSTNGSLDAADTFLGSRSVAALAPGEISTSSTVVTIPPGTATGSYYLLAKSDADNSVVETNETNNTTYTYLQIGSDLTLSGFTAPANGGAGATIVVTDTTRNSGGGPVGASTTRFYLSGNASVDAGDAVLGSRSVPALAAGETSTASTTVTIPAGTGPGWYYLLAKADADDVVAELNETNNTTYTYIQIGPDLVFAGFYGPPSAAPGSSITVTDSTRNQGAGSTPASVTRFYLSTNSTVDAGDVYLGSRSIAGLAGSETSTGDTVLVIPAGTAAGWYYLIAKADADNGVTELDETNNTSYRFIQIVP
jgi:subtilase family serine protease